MRDIIFRVVPPSVSPIGANGYKMIYSPTRQYFVFDVIEGQENRPFNNSFGANVVALAPRVFYRMSIRTVKS